MKCKKTVDYRKLSRPAKEEVRYTAVKRVEAGVRIPAKLNTDSGGT